MKPNLRIIALAFALAMTAGALWLVYLADVTTSRPVGVFVQPGRVDFGPVKQVEVPHSFTITNRTDKAITLGKVFAMCGCTRVQIPVTRLEPGGSTIGKCIVDFKGRRGEFKTAFDVVYTIDGDPAKHGIRYSLEADVEPVIKLSESRLEFPAKKVGRTTVWISSDEEPDVKVLAVRINNKAFEVAIAEDRQSFTVEFDPARVDQNSDASDATIQTNCHRERSIRLPISILKHQVVANQ